MLGADNGDPLYVRVLRLRYIRPGALVSFLLCEGTITVAGLLAFAELASWWIMMVAPMAVAAMVKINDLVAGAFAAAPTLALAGAPGGVRAARAGGYVDPPFRGPVAGPDRRQDASVAGRHVASGTLYGRRQLPDDDLTPAVGCARRNVLETSSDGQHSRSEAGEFARQMPSPTPGLDDVLPCVPQRGGGNLGYGDGRRGTRRRCLRNQRPFIL